MDTDARVALWQAFSGSFLDTEPDEATFRYVARVVRESSATREQAESILWNEVFPVLYGNLESVAGEWVGWSREWLVANIRPSNEPARRIGPEAIVQEIQRCWGQALEHLGSHA